MEIKACKGDRCECFDGIKSALRGSIGIGESVDKLFRYVSKDGRRDIEFVPMHIYDKIEITINGDTARFKPAPPVRINLMQR